MGGKQSGPAAELVLSFMRILLIICGVIVTSEMPGLLGGMRLGKGGTMPSSLVKTDSKYLFQELMKIIIRKIENVRLNNIILQSFARCQPFDLSYQ